MKYFYINPYEENEKPILIKLSKKIDSLISKMAKLSQQHAKLDKQVIQELSKINNISEDEISDILASYDFTVNVSQYGLGNFEISTQELTKEEYNKIIKKVN